MVENVMVYELSHTEAKQWHDGEVLSDGRHAKSVIREAAVRRAVERHCSSVVIKTKGDERHRSRVLERISVKVA